MTRLWIAPLVVCLFAPAGALSQTDEDFFDNTVVHEIRLTLQPGDWQALRDNYLLNTYYPCDFGWNDITVGNIGIRSRGSGSRSPEKPNLAVSFDQYVQNQRFLGRKTINLKANNQDASMMRETVSMLLLARMGLPAPREAHARLFVNGEFFGLYAIVEPINKDFLTRVFQENGGYLYEFSARQYYYFEYLGDDPAQYSFFEPKTHESKPQMETLVQMIHTINFAPDAEFQAAVSEYVDLKTFLTLIAVDNYLADVDGALSDVFGMNNFYLYRPEDSNVATFLRWDPDLTFSYARRPVLQGIAENVLARRAFEVPELRNLYLEAMLQAASLAGGEGGWMQEELRRQYDLIAEDARRDPHKVCREFGELPRACNAEDFEAEVVRMLAFAAERHQYVVEETGRLLRLDGPRLSENGALTAGSSVPALVPGSLATLYGASLAEKPAEATSLPLPNTHFGVSVTVNGIPAPLLFVSPTQVNFQVPWTTPQGKATVRLSLYGMPSNTIETTVAPAVPGIFVAVHAADYGLITMARPVEAGEAIVLFATGLGQVDPMPLDGEAPGEFPSVMVDRPELTIGGRPAQVLFAGLAPGMVGVFQINALLPAEIPSGATPLVLSVGGEASPAWLVVAR
ncbi:MAG: CotH kinase family protein [Bryobacteraceae bacterium]|nr:CotH kinase family protein [Bryobacteraceae bacterium]